MRREVKGRINPFLLNPTEYGQVYVGVSDESPKDLTYIKSSMQTKSVFKLGLSIKYTTNDKGQYEIFAYPKDFGKLTTIIQNNITRINIVEAWDFLQVTKNGKDYYLYYTMLPQYQDVSTFLFKI